MRFDCVNRAPAECSIGFLHPAGVMREESKIGVTRAQHRGETRHFFFASTLLARLLEMPMIAHFLERAFAVDSLLQPPQGTINGLAFF